MPDVVVLGTERVVDVAAAVLELSRPRDDPDSPARVRLHRSTAALYRSLDKTWIRFAWIESGVPNSNPVISLITAGSSSAMLNGSRGTRCGSGAWPKDRIIHGWLRTSESGARWEGLVTNIRDRMCLHSWESHMGESNRPRLILAWRAGMDWSSNGTLPHTSTYNTTPNDQTSTSGPV